MLENCNFVFFLGLKVTLWLYKVCDSVIELRNQKHYNSVAHILPDIGKVTCLTLENVCDLDVEGHSLVVQGL